MNEKELHELEFAVEVSTRYHEWRRSTLEFMANTIRALILVGAVLALIGVFAPEGRFTWWLIVVGSAAIALIALFDLVFGVDSKARLHTDLYQRFKRLQVEIAANRADWPQRINGWRAESQSIRIDEPPVLWAIYIASWNQALGRRKVNPSDFRRLSGLQKMVGWFWPFRPDDFPLVGK